MVIDIQQFEKHFGTKDTQRILRASDPSTPESEKKELCRKVWSNRLVHLKREVRVYCKEKQSIWERIFIILSKLEIENRKTFINQYLINDLEEVLGIYHKLVLNNSSLLAISGRMLLGILPYYEQFASDHDFAQIINANVREVERCREDYNQRVAEGKRKPEDSFFTALIYVYKSEPDDDCPFMEAMWHFFLQSIEENNELKTQVWNKAEECLPELRDCMVTLSEDEDGQLVGQKYYPPLKLIK